MEREASRAAQQRGKPLNVAKLRGTSREAKQGRAEMRNKVLGWIEEEQQGGTEWNWDGEGGWREHLVKGCQEVMGVRPPGAHRRPWLAGHEAELDGWQRERQQAVKRMRDCTERARREDAAEPRRGESARKEWLRTVGVEGFKEWGVTTKQATKLATEWWDSGVTDGERRAVEERAQLRRDEYRTKWTTWAQTPVGQAVLGWRQEIKRNRSVRMKAEREWEREWWGPLLAQTTDMRHDMGTFHRVLKMLPMVGPRGGTISKLGKEARGGKRGFTADEAQAEVMQWVGSPGQAEEGKVEQWVPQGPTAPELDEPLTQEEIGEAIRKLRPSAGGPDGVAVEAIKTVGGTEKGSEWLLRELTKVWMGGEAAWPDTWLEAEQVPLYKGKGPKEDPGNYRYVTLIGIMGRLLARVIAARLSRWTEGLPGDEWGSGWMGGLQFGFRRGVSVEEAGSVVRRIQEEMAKREISVQVGGVLLDLRKAYGSVPRRALWDTLARLGMQRGGRCWEALRMMHEETTYVVRGEGSTRSSGYKAHRGLREGCPSSPTLFNIYVAGVLREAVAVRRAQWGNSVGVGWRWAPAAGLLRPMSTVVAEDFEYLRLPHLAFADDVVVLVQGGGEGQETLEGAANTVSRVMSAWGLAENLSKREVWLPQRLDEPPPRYLGMKAQPKADMQLREARGWKLWGALRPKLTHTRLREEDRARLTTTLLRATVLFGSASRTFTEAERRRLKRQEAAVLRGATGWSRGAQWKLGVSMKTLQSRWQVRDWEEAVAVRKLRWVGHVCRRPWADSVARKVMFGEWWGEEVSQGRKQRERGYRLVGFRQELGRLIESRGGWAMEVGLVAEDRSGWERWVQQRGRWPGTPNGDRWTCKWCEKQDREDAAREEGERKRTAGMRSAGRAKRNRGGHGEWFREMAQYRRHVVRWHVTLREVPCPRGCGRLFGKRDQAVLHGRGCDGDAAAAEAAGWGEKPTKTDNSAGARHKRTLVGAAIRRRAHTDPHDYPHVCPTCQMRYRRPDGLRIHVEACAQGGWKCEWPECEGRRFGSKGARTLHLRTLHAGVQPPPSGEEGAE